MAITSDTTTVNDSFFKPLDGLAAASPNTFPCREYPDERFVRLGLQRVLENCDSGRNFLQEHAISFDNPPGLENYFASLRSERRLAMVRDVDSGVRDKANASLPDRLAQITELDNYECFGGDGHWHGAAAHDERHNGVKMAVGHFYSVNLRTHTLSHLAVAEGLHENDMHALKRIKPKGLRHGVPKGRRVLIVYDRAGIDYKFWDRCRREVAAYFISRRKDGMVFELAGSLDWDNQNPSNNGVTCDWKVKTNAGQELRLITYMDPLSGKLFEFLTNDFKMSPGVIAELYRRRWDIEKIFDEVKNKLHEKKAWTTNLTGREIQAKLITITHNLLVMYENELEIRHGIVNHAENQRRAERLEEAARICQEIKAPLSSLVLDARRATQISVKFIRWLRSAIREKLTEAAAMPHLNQLYARL